MVTALGILAVVGLILANGYFVAQEFSYVAVRRGRIEDLAGAGDRRAARALEVLKRLSFMLSGAQLGITVTSLLVGYIAEPTLGAALTPVVSAFGVPPAAAGGIAFTVAFILATTAQMVFGELAPKNLGIARPEAFSLALASSTRLYLRFAKPLIALFDNSSNRLLRSIGIEPVEELQGGVSPEELEYIIEHSGREGAISKPQASLLTRALEFRSLDAAAAMVPRPQVVTVGVGATCDELRRLSLDSGHSRFPVVGQDLDDVRGVIQAKDVLRVPADQRAETPIDGLMAAPVAIPESALLAPLLVDMRSAQTQLALVVDEYGGTAGIVTLEDIIEELVGEIQDEYDAAEPVTQALPDGTFMVPGSWRLDETARDTGVELPDGDYDTLSGLIMDRLGRLPEVNDEVGLDHAVLRVAELSGRAVGRVALTPTEPGADNGSGDDQDEDRSP